MRDDGTDGFTAAERMKRQRTAKAIARAKASQRATAGRIDDATRRTLDSLRARDGEPW